MVGSVKLSKIYSVQAYQFENVALLIFFIELGITGGAAQAYQFANVLVPPMFVTELGITGGAAQAYQFANVSVPPMLAIAPQPVKHTVLAYINAILTQYLSKLGNQTGAVGTCDSIGEKSLGGLLGKLPLLALDPLGLLGGQTKRTRKGLRNMETARFDMFLHLVNPDPKYAPFEICLSKTETFGVYRVLMCMSMK